MKEHIDKAVEVLRAGGIILYPTDTIWGIGCDATNSDAVEKVYKLKGSIDKKSMLILVDKIDNLVRYVGNVPSVAWDLLEMTDKPLTLILPGAHGISTSLIPEDGSVGVRVPDHEFCTKLIQRLGRPLVSTSPNLSGEPTPLTFRTIPKVICDGVDFIVSPQFEGKGTKAPSSIISLNNSGVVNIIRE